MGMDIQGQENSARNNKVIVSPTGQILQATDSLVLGNIDEYEEKGEHPGALPNPSILQDQLAANRTNPHTTSADALRIHNISAYGTKLKQKLQNFRERSRKGSESNITPRGALSKKLKDVSFDQDVGVM